MLEERMAASIVYEIYLDLLSIISVSAVHLLTQTDYLVCSLLLSIIYCVPSLANSPGMIYSNSYIVMYNNSEQH